ncbi:hypothetical protein KUTeg_020077 [Tegillarca granosa]|uniref:Testin n=1 Tax=Tegillarca granosa TaxID=220873 RepID=A0ABQ9EC60_TEGGR|nr:hypothetical protein KUTeg_020077 [Tegillarca granosa]
MAATSLVSEYYTDKRDFECSTNGTTRQKCLKCGDKCPGLDTHYWRKVCKHCRCPREDHDLQPTEDTTARQPINLLYDSLPRHGDKMDLQRRMERLSMHDPSTHADICSPDNDIVLSRIVSENLRSQKYIAMLPKDKQMFAAQLRRKQLQKQLPLHDLHQNFCNSLSEKELFKFQKFTEKRKSKAAGIGSVGDVPQIGDYKCHRCLKSMENNSISVFADRMGHGTCWHPGCFTCATCNELLVDMIYFCRNEDIYCERHYADSIYPRCSACDEIIFAREYTQAEKQTWHVQHFCCWYCDCPLAGQRYIGKNDNPYCMNCFDRLYSKDGNLFCSGECKQFYFGQPQHLFPRHMHP